MVKKNTDKNFIVLRQQFIRFCIVGFFTTIINYLTFFYLYSFLEIHYLPSAAIGFCIGVSIGFSFNKAWTFNSYSKVRHEPLLYGLVYICNLLIGLNILESCVIYLKMDPKIGNIIAIVITSILNFLGIKFAVFKK
jgi:putative flippase GtrA